MAGHGTDMAQAWQRYDTDMARHGKDMAQMWHRYGTYMAQRHLPIFRTQLNLVSVPWCVELRNSVQPDVSHLISCACCRINVDYRKIVIY